jgi:hypothetical protein
MALKTRVKRPDEELKYDWDFSNQEEFREPTNATITSIEDVSFEPDDDGTPDIDDPPVSDGVARVQALVLGGADGRSYAAKCLVGTSSGEKRQVTGILKIEAVKVRTP